MIKVKIILHFVKIFYTEAHLGKLLKKCLYKIELYFIIFDKIRRIFLRVIIKSQSNKNDKKDIRWCIHYAKFDTQ